MEKGEGIRRKGSEKAAKVRDRKSADSEKTLRKLRSAKCFVKLSDVGKRQASDKSS